jgi:asparaginyl-tRNA synthetase
MKQLYIRDLLTHGGNAEVVLPCWLRSRRTSGGIYFLDVVDSTGIVQVVVEKGNTSADDFSTAEKVLLESAIEVRGDLVRHANKPREISARSIRVIGEAAFPISPSPRSSVDIFDPKLTNHLLTNRHLYLRNPKVMAILRFRSLLTMRIREWFERQSFVEIDAPILTPVPLYDDGSAMGIDVKGEQVFLTQCVGYYLEAAVHAFERVYNMGPSFRGEESRSPRHLMEYHHIKAEIAFADLEDIIRIVEDLISFITGVCWNEGGDIVNALETKMCLDGLQTPFPRISYEDAIKHLQGKGFSIDFGKSLGGAEEVELSTLFRKPFWVTGIPRSVEPFPYCVDAANPKITRTADLIASNGFGELLGVAEKIHDISMLDERLAEKGKAGDPRFEWIREVHQLGCVPHAAFGMGVERMVRWLLNVPHVRDAIPFPRIFRRKIAP